MNDRNRDDYRRGERAYERQHEDRGPGWRREEDRYRREAYGRHNEDDSYGERDFGYGRSFRDDDYGGRGSHGRRDWGERRSYDMREYYAPRDYDRRDDRRDFGRDDRGETVHWHEHDRERRAGHPYQGQYGGTGDSSWFTGQQGSWAMPGPAGPGMRYGTTGYGADYRSHRYADRDDHRGFWDKASDEVASWFGDEDAARRREEDHRGRGPQGYTRSDERIREDANDRLTDDWQIDASHVVVRVEDGEITLDGTVSSRAAKRRAEDVVDDVSGVRHVQNNLRVEQATTSSGAGSAYTGNRGATNATATTEGGTLSRNQSETAAQRNKV